MLAEHGSEVRVDLDHWLVRGESRELDRQKYFNVHGNPRELNEEELRLVVDELGASFGRGLGRLSSVLAKAGEDPQRPGHANLRRLSKTPVARAKSSAPGELVESAHPFSYFEPKEGEAAGERFVPAGPEEAAEAVVAYLKSHPNPPRYFEVANELNVHVGHYRTDWDEACRLHTEIARAVHDERLSVMVGGPTAAYPAFELKDFTLWNKHMGPFIRRAGRDLDFLSVHLYTTHWDDKVNYRYGANTDAILDLMANESYLHTGSVKPLVISECGRGFRKGEAIHDEYSPRRDWMVISGANHAMFGLYRRDHELLKALPFIVLKASWYRSEYPYPWVLFHRHGEHWETTHLAKWYRFWRNAEGRHLPVTTEDPQLQTMAFSADEEVQVYIDNLSQSDRSFTLPIDLAKVESIMLRRLYFDDSEPSIEEEAVDAASAIRVTMHPEEAVLVRLRMKGPLEPSRELVESTCYGDQTLVPLGDGGASVVIRMDEGSDPVDAACLRVGVSRPRGLSQEPRVRFNGTLLSGSPKRRGEGETLLPDRFGVLEYRVPAGLVKGDNRVSVEYSEPGGRLATAALNVRREQEAAEATHERLLGRSSNPRAGWLATRTVRQQDE
ncbi:Beta-porphyranase A precursor [Planctomycetes bacterium MalM25]|nr:Beta-porphyranase A precursor [Planctomycetes bacterium MalM25]